MTTTIKCFVSLTNGSAVVSLTAANAGNAGLNLSAPNVIEDMLLIVQDPVNALRIIKGSLSTTSFELQEAWNGTTVTNAQARISTSGAAISGLTQAIRDLITKYAAVPYGNDGLTLADTMMRLVGSADPTKVVKFEVDGLTTGTTRTVTVPDADVTIPTQAQMDSKFDKSGGAISGNVSVTGQLTTTDNIGIGMTPSAWSSGWKVIESSAASGVVIASANANPIHLGSNWVSDSGGNKYKTTGAATLFEVGNGGVKCYIAPPGTAGDAISFKQAITLDESGYLLVGFTTSIGHHVFKKASSTAGDSIFSVTHNGTGDASKFCVADGAGASLASTVLFLGKAGSRSINAAGTINASGADYAEYENNNGTKFGKGQVVGFKEDGTLTDVYADAIRFGVKSTNPSLVGGDSWGTDKQVGKRPDEPQFAAPEYQGQQDPGAAPTEPVQQVLPEDASGEDKPKASDDFAAAHAAWVTASAEHEKLAYEYRAAQTDHAARVEIAKSLFDTATYPEYQRALAAFEARLEAKRQDVDRIAYCGKVPVAVYDATPGGYIIADKDSDGKIIGKFVADPDFAQYKKAVGRVNRIMDAEASAHLVEAINSQDAKQFVGMAEVAVIIH